MFVAMPGLCCFLLVALWQHVLSSFELSLTVAATCQGSHVLPHNTEAVSGVCDALPIQEKRPSCVVPAVTGSAPSLLCHDCWHPETSF